MKPEEKNVMEQKVKEKAREGKLACAQAFQLADEFDVTLREIGRVADRLNIKIYNCQLGCF